MVIGRLGRPHGVRGVMHARPTGVTLAGLQPGETVHVMHAGGGASREVLSVEGSGERLRLRLSGVDDRDAASALAGAFLSVPAARVRVPDAPDTFLVSDLVGCAVHAGDVVLGTVTDVLPAPANDALEVRTADGATVLLPFTADAVRDIDAAARRITVREGLVGD